jgi:hypothetical protein
MNLVRRFKQYSRQNALVSADPFDDGDWHRRLVVAGASPSLGSARDHVLETRATAALKAEERQTLLLCLVS